MIVFIQPHTESLVGLLAMTLPVMALSAWIAAGSERIAYAGIQIGFTFSLAFLSWFGPLTNLTELRDRVIGILLGVLVSSIVHLYLWPDSEARSSNRGWPISIGGWRMTCAPVAMRCS
jgi:multidrug resistance protein MdtO